MDAEGEDGRRTLSGQPDPDDHVAIPTEDSVQNDICVFDALLQLLYTLQNRYLEVLALLQKALVDIL
jgi:hypothetical protein